MSVSGILCDVKVSFKLKG